MPNRASVEAMLRSAGFAITANPEQEMFICEVANIPTDYPHCRPAWPCKKGRGGMIKTEIFWNELNNKS